MFHSRLTAGRFIAIIMIVLMHITVTVIFDRSMQSFTRKEHIDVTTYMMLVSPDQPPLKPEQHDSSRRNVATVVKPESLQSEKVFVSAVPDFGGERRRISDAVDWDVLASAVAKRTARNQLDKESKRPLDSKPKELDKPNGDMDPGIFGRGRPPVPGTTVDLGGGVFQTWVSADCYISSESDVATGKRYLTRGWLLKYRTKCLQPLEDGSNLFERFKPEYLKKPVEEICSNTTTGCDKKK